MLDIVAPFSYEKVILDPRHILFLRALTNVRQGDVDGLIE